MNTVKRQKDLYRPDCIYLRPIPLEVKNVFKAECARRGITMTDAVVEFMRQSPRLLNNLKRMKILRDKGQNPIAELQEATPLTDPS